MPNTCICQFLLISFYQNDKRDDFDFEIVNFPFLDRSTSYGVYIHSFC